jgi:hypothetical protein
VRKHLSLCVIQFQSFFFANFVVPNRKMHQYLSGWPGRPPDGAWTHCQMKEKDWCCGCVIRFLMCQVVIITEYCWLLFCLLCQTNAARARALSCNWHSDRLPNSQVLAPRDNQWKLRNTTEFALFQWKINKFWIERWKKILPTDLNY